MGISNDIPANPMIMSVNSCSIGLTWLPPNNGVGITGYNIYRDGVFIGSTEESVYNDNSGLSSETSYSYRISAVYSNGNETDKSEPVSAVTLSVPVSINPDCEIIPAHSLADWSGAGVVGGIPDYDAGINVMDYGAVGDGAADDTAAIIAAIAACPEYRAVFFPAGTYLLTATVYVSKPIVLRGEGPAATILRDSHRNAAITYNQGADYAGIEDLHVNVVYQLDNGTGTKILFTGIENSWVKNIETSGYTDRTVDIQDSSHCEIRDSYFHHNEEEAVNEGYTHWYGVHVGGFNTKANYNLVENNIFDWYSSR